MADLILPSHEDVKILSKKRRRRTIIGQRDLEKLEKLFEEDRWPSRERKERLARNIGKSEIFINTWFQNRRARSRREEKVENKRLTFHAVDDCIFKTKQLIREELENKKSTKKPVSLLESGEFQSGLSFVPWDSVFARIIRMVCASEDLVQRSSIFFTEAIHDACRGIPLKDGKLIYNKDYGLDITERKF